MTEYAPTKPPSCAVFLLYSWSRCPRIGEALDLADFKTRKRTLTPGVPVLSRKVPGWMNSNASLSRPKIRHHGCHVNSFLARFAAGGEPGTCI
jgi:hypothetical protein